MKTAWRSSKIVTPTGIVDGVLLVDDDKIVAVTDGDEVPSGYTLRDVGLAAILPGFIDAHVHINEPGRTEWEGFETATKAAAKAGITMVADMPLNSMPVTTTLDAWEQKVAAAKDKLYVNVALYAGAVPGNVNQLSTLVDSGAVAAKCFMVHSGIDEFPNTSIADIRQALLELRAHQVPLLAHAELEIGQSYDKRNPRSYAAWVTSRPEQMEIAAIEALFDLCRETGAWVHIVHLATGAALPLIAAAKSQGLRITVETAPHYLYFAAEDIPDGATQFKCAPPIRSSQTREALWRGLIDGTIDMIASDHSPAPPAVKQLESGDFTNAWGGIGGLQFGPSATWTQMSQRGLGLPHLAHWWSTAPAKLIGMSALRGSLLVGKQADFVVFDPDATMTITEADIEHRHKVSPYVGEILRGKALTTVVGGQVVYDDENGCSQPKGRIVLNPKSGLAQFNALSPESQAIALTRCCGASNWVRQVQAALPIASRNQLFALADRVWADCSTDDYKEAFTHHPKIGDVSKLREKFAATASWSAGEQSGVNQANEEVLQALAQGNADYEAKFGYIFIVCATGKTASEMLALLQARLPNDPAKEIYIAAEEQRKITHIRLEKLLQGG